MLALSGCATVQRTAGLGEVDKQLSARIGEHVSWQQNRDEDRAAEAKVSELLAGRPDRREGRSHRAAQQPRTAGDLRAARDRAGRPGAGRPARQPGARIAVPVRRRGQSARSHHHPAVHERHHAGGAQADRRGPGRAGSPRGGAVGVRAVDGRQGRLLRGAGRFAGHRAAPASHAGDRSGRRAGGPAVSGRHPEPQGPGVAAGVLRAGGARHGTGASPARQRPRAAQPAARSVGPTDAVEGAQPPAAAAIRAAAARSSRANGRRAAAGPGRRDPRGRGGVPRLRLDPRHAPAVVAGDRRDLQARAQRGKAGRAGCGPFAARLRSGPGTRCADRVGAAPQRAQARGPVGRCPEPGARCASTRASHLRRGQPLPQRAAAAAPDRGGGNLEVLQRHAGRRLRAAARSADAGPDRQAVRGSEQGILARLGRSRACRWRQRAGAATEPAGVSAAVRRRPPPAYPTDSIHQLGEPQ